MTRRLSGALYLGGFTLPLLVGAVAYGDDVVPPAGPPAENSTATCMKQNGRVLLDKDGNETCRHDLDQWRKASDDCLASGGNFVDAGDRNDDWTCIQPSK
jgi:hypothetical protein